MGTTDVETQTRADTADAWSKVKREWCKKTTTTIQDFKKEEKAAMAAMAAMAASRPDVVVVDTKQEKTVVMELTNPG